MAATIGMGGGAANITARAVGTPEPHRNPFAKSSGGTYKPTPRGTRPKAWKRAFSGIACHGLKASQFAFE